MGRTKATENWNEARKADAIRRYQAALAYGDPATINYWAKKATELGAPGITELAPGATPLGEVAKIAKEEAENQRQNVLTHNANNTFFSGLKLNDQNRILGEANESRAGALKALENAINELNEVEKEAEAIFNEEMEGFERQDIERSEEEEAATEPVGEEESSSPSGGGGGGGGSKHRRKRRSNNNNNGNSVGRGHPVGPALSRGHRAR
jgi:hypothetical protein